MLRIRPDRANALSETTLTYEIQCLYDVGDEHLKSTRYGEICER